MWYLIIAVICFYMIDTVATFVYCYIQEKRQKKKEVDTPQKSKSVVLYESDYKFPKRQIKWLFHIYAGWIRYKLIHLGKIPCHTYRNFMLRHVYRMKLAKTAVIYGGFEIRSPWNIHIADGAIVGDESKLDGRNGIFIGKNVNLSTGVWIWTEQHDINDPHFYSNETGGAVIVQDRVWISSRVTVLPKTKIYEGAVVAAGAVVTKNCEAYTIYGGIPAKKIGERSKKLFYEFTGRHLKPLTIIFFNTITALIYVNADITMLGWIKGDSVVGEYTIAVKVYTVIKNILVAIYAAVTPRLATMMSETAESQYKKLNTTIWCYLSLILIPAGFGLTAVSKDVMLLVGGEEIATTSFSLQILSISLIFAIYGGLITSVYNITQGREKENLMATTVSAIINCGLNLYMIPKYSLYGAAFTTLLSELFVFVFCTLRAPNKKRFFDVDEIKNSILYAVVGSILVLLTTKVVYMLVECSALLRLIIAVALSAVVYITYLIIFKNKYTIDIVRNIMVKIKKKY